MPDAIAELVESVGELAPADAFRLYLQAVKDGEGAHQVAYALRVRARAGGFDDFPDAVSIFRACLDTAPDELTLLHLAKALAAFGRAARAAAGELAAQLAAVRVVDDMSFMAADGIVWALGYLGGEAAKAGLAEMAAAAPCLATAHDDVYEGTLSAEQRAAHWRASIAGALELAVKDDVAPWRSAIAPPWDGLAPRAKRKSVLEVRTGGSRGRRGE